MAIFNVAGDEEIKSVLTPEVARNLIDARDGNPPARLRRRRQIRKRQEKEAEYDQLTLDFYE